MVSTDMTQNIRTLKSVADRFVKVQSAGEMRSRTSQLNRRLKKAILLVALFSVRP